MSLAGGLGIWKTLTWTGLAVGRWMMVGDELEEDGWLLVADVD
jgi:hypothetical protein